MNAERVVVDANLAFKALTAGRGDLRDRLNPSENIQFFSPRFLFVELFKHKERLSRAARVTEGELLEALHTLMTRLAFVTEDNIPIGTWMEAHRLCHAVCGTHAPLGRPLVDGRRGVEAWSASEEV